MLRRCLLRSTADSNAGTTIATRMPRTATTTINSTSVKPSSEPLRVADIVSFLIVGNVLCSGVLQEPFHICSDDEARLLANNIHL
jgi:hypothetical protein